MSQEDKRQTSGEVTLFEFEAAQFTDAAISSLKKHHDPAIRQLALLLAFDNGNDNDNDENRPHYPYQHCKTAPWRRILALTAHMGHFNHRLIRRTHPHRAPRLRLLFQLHTQLMHPFFAPNMRRTIQQATRPFFAKLGKLDIPYTEPNTTFHTSYLPAYDATFATAAAVRRRNCSRPGEPHPTKEGLG